MKNIRIAALGNVTEKAFIYHETQKKQLETEGKVILNTLQKSANKNTVIVEETPSDDVTEESDTDNNTPSEK